MTALPEPGSSPARRPESQLDVSVPHRAGAIVTEFISSIVGEAQSRADQIVVAASEEAGPQRIEALAAAARVRECHDALSEALVALRNDLRREADWLYADPRISAHVKRPSMPATPALVETVPTVDSADTADTATAQPAETVEPAETAETESEEHAHETVTAEVVHEDVEEEAAGELVVQESDEDVVDAQEPDNRFERMSDEELARAHANAVKAAARDADGKQADSMRRLAHAALQEALRRPVFAEASPPKARRRRLSRVRRRRRSEAALVELRDACQRALAR